jgi:ribonuclease Z
MATLHLLGTGAALSDARRTTTMLAVATDRSFLVVDCGGDLVHRLLAHELELDHLTGVILTHEHPDHVGGFPLFVEKIWLAGRRLPIPVYGPEAALSQARRILESFDMTGWEGLPDIEWHEVPLREEAPVLEDADWRVTASPGEHSVPVIAVRIEARGAGRIAYSADTGPVATVARLARGVDILVHEASGEFPGHSTMGEAARIAADARAGRLVLVHLPPEPSASELAMARKWFDNLELGEDGARYRF